MLMGFCRFFSGSLLMRNLSQVVHKDDFIHDSEYLQTVFVAVPL